MDIIEETFHAYEHEKFVTHVCDGLPPEFELKLYDLIIRYSQGAQRKEYIKRLEMLRQEPGRSAQRSRYEKVYGIAGVNRYETSNGQIIYRIPVMCFNRRKLKTHYTNCCLIIGRALTLVDCGSPISKNTLDRGFRVVKDFFGECVKPGDVSNVIITHAHIDHFGGLAFLSSERDRNIFVHRDDVRTVENVPAQIEQRLEKVTGFLKRSGHDLSAIDEFIDHYTNSKRFIKGFPVSHPVEDGDRIIEDFEVIHVPGHSPGQITLQVGDVMMLGDHILKDITPHQFPKIYGKGMGLSSYLQSLHKIYKRTQPIRIGIGGHNGDVHDVRKRALEIIDQHHLRLADLHFLIERPACLADLTRRYFNEIEGRQLHGYEQILAMEEIQAHIEYLIDVMKYVEIVPASAVDPDVLRFRPILSSLENSGNCI